MGSRGHQAITYHDKTLSIPIRISNPDASRGLFGFVVLWVDDETGIYELGRIDHQNLPDCVELACYGLPSRSLYIEDYLYSLSTNGMMINSLQDPNIVFAEILFHVYFELP